ncbi:TetR family transcriptional regulator [Umezawaea sp. Da 62-37]|uniref:TetR family transcriptional regulator n=1 Tax=Umezawaea sp. Da 62-37 TaxID=3075927 RepID=UPI0028F71EC1|nr:TetR family transcriptional regulator [Umezawaea sp. Da 62-37]WNV83552.1 TetR family transcriptional regulator [Umezawaea sp. Da 62-37]
MVRDVEQTKRRLREAALAEFAEHGLHGTTVERIASRAGVNKERLYSYFGDKTALFTSIVVEEVDKVTAAVPLAVASLDDVAEFAGATFDYNQDHPDLTRLVLWEGLAHTGVLHDAANRGAHYENKVAVMAAAQRAGLVADTPAAPHLVFLLLALAGWWSATPQIARMFADADADTPGERAARRAAVVEAARRLASPRA